MTTADTAPLRKARGAFFTPPTVARYVTEWAVRSSTDAVLEPSCGEAAFLHPAAERLAQLSPDGRASGRLDGVELHADSAASARRLLAGVAVDSTLVTADFFSVEPEPKYDAVIGNPPYVRYQAFSGVARTNSQAAALRAGVRLTALASSWAAFTVHAALFLRPGGRLGLVVPAELMSVNYAAEVRKFLLRRFSSVRLVLFTGRIFPGVLEEVVLLLADGYDPTGRSGTDHFELFEAENAEALRLPVVMRRWTPVPPGGKWTGSLLPSGASEAFAKVLAHDGFTTLDTWGDTTLGMVTGNNRYFALSPDRVAELGLTRSDLLPLSPPGSRHLRGLAFTESARTEMGRSGSATWLFRPAGEPSKAARDYIDHGVRLGVEEAYKCRVRTPWWRVPLLRPAGLLLTYMNADTPRLCSNRAGVHHLNSVHGLYVRSGLKTLAMDLLPLAALNMHTFVGAETVGRAYGGGMLKIEPREADTLPVPSPELLASARAKLTALRPQVATALRGGKMTDAARIVDQVILVGELGLRRAEVSALRDAHRELMARRVARGLEPRVPH